VIVPPNAAAVITGRKRLSADGSEVGYRSVIGGRTLKVPIVETVDYMTLETIPIDITVNNAFSKGNIPLNIEAIANVKIASEPETVFNNAVERLLGKTEDEIRQLAKDTLMGNLRGVLATLTPEQVNEDRIGFARAMTADAGEDLSALGFQLDVLKIQNVSDEGGYLEAIGRKKSAEAIKDAQIAEAVAVADTRERQAQAKQRAEVTEAQADIKIAEAHNSLRVREAELGQLAEIAEKTAKVRAEEAEVEAQKALEQRRVEREHERLRADVIAPATAAKEAAVQEAQGQAAPIYERGRAQVQVLKMLYEEIRQGGDQAFAVFLAEKLPELLETAVDAVSGIDIERLVVMDSGEGNAVNNAVNQRVKGAFGTLEGVSQAIGIDIQEVLAAAADRMKTGEGSPSARLPAATPDGEA